MPKLSDGLIVFSDLDGSLLDHDTYDWQPARQWLARLRAHDIPVILTTSKTQAEVSVLRQELGLEHWPFIAENGALAVLPDSWRDHPDYPRKTFSADYGLICTQLQRLRREAGYDFTGFSDLTPQEVADLTGLTASAAQRACQRDASEPIQWHGDDRALQSFRQALARHGLELTQGGRFHHVMGGGVSKGEAARWLLAQYRQRRPQPAISLGLGDGPNDVSLLRAMDYAVAIAGKNQQQIALGDRFAGEFYRTRAMGPAGWREGLSHFIDHVQDKGNAYE